MEEKTFYEWAMDELRLARKEAEETESIKDPTILGKRASKYQMTINDLAKEILRMLCNHDCGSIESYAAIKTVEKLLDHEPLTAVTDESDQWAMYDSLESDGSVHFQHIRNFGLFKTYYKNGTMRVTDVDRVCYANVLDDETDFSFRNTHLTRLIDEVYHPITFPYTSEEIRVKVKRLDGSDFREDLPTIVEVISYSVNNGPFEKIGRFYRYNKETRLWDEISPFVYYNHKNVIETTKMIYEEYDTAKKGCPCHEN